MLKSVIFVTGILSSIWLEVQSYPMHRLNTERTMIGETLSNNTTSSEIINKTDSLPIRVRLQKRNANPQDGGRVNVAKNGYHNTTVSRNKRVQQEMSDLKSRIGEVIKIISILREDNNRLFIKKMNHEREIDGEHTRKEASNSSSQLMGRIDRIAFELERDRKENEGDYSNNVTLLESIRMLEAYRRKRLEEYKNEMESYMAQLNILKEQKTTIGKPVKRKLWLAWTIIGFLLAAGAVRLAIVVFRWYRRRSAEKENNKDTQKKEKPKGRPDVESMTSQSSRIQAESPSNSHRKIVVLPDCDLQFSSAILSPSAKSPARVLDSKLDSATSCSTSKDLDSWIDTKTA